jgi:cyclohexadienyl dehydratase
MRTRLLLVLLVALFVACGAPPATPRRGAAPAPAVLRAGTSGDYPPFSRWTGDRPEGFAPALLAAFTERERVDLSWTRVRWPELVADLRAGRFDVAADGITVRPERSVAGRFTVPIAKGGAILLLRRPAWAPAALPREPLDAIRAIDRRELRVVVNEGGHLECVARALFATADVRAIPDNTKVKDALARHEADAAMTNTFEAPRWAEGIAGVDRIGPTSRSDSTRGCSTRRRAGGSASSARACSAKAAAARRRRP